LLRNRSAFPSESVDLIYLDPPFNSKKDYNSTSVRSPGDPIVRSTFSKTAGIGARHARMYSGI
jgi:16S rRNA G966 N2-methylase RsmD